jgi:hypothetical protein
VAEVVKEELTVLQPEPVPERLAELLMQPLGL